MSDKIRYRQAGDPFSMAAGEFNMIADHVNSSTGAIHKDSHPFRDSDLANPSIADVYAHQSIDLRDIVALNTIGLDDPNGDPADEWPNFASSAISASHIGKFGIAQEGAFVADDMLPSVVHGLAFCKLNVPANGEFIDRADIDPADNTRLLSQLNGSAQILWQDTGTGVVDAIVRLGNAEYTHATGKANGDIAAGAINGVVRVWDNGADTGYDIPDVRHTWMTGDLPVSSGKEVIATWFPYEGIWRITHAECEDPQTTIGQLGMASGSDTQVVAALTPVAVSSFDASENLNTPNVTIDETQAMITLPDIVGSNQLYQASVSATFLAPSNNAIMSLWLYVNGIQSTPPIATVQVQNAASSQTISALSYLNVAPQSSPTAAIWVESSNAGTITWTNALFNFKRIFE